MKILISKAYTYIYIYTAHNGAHNKKTRWVLYRWLYMIPVCSRMFMYVSINFQLFHSLCQTIHINRYVWYKIDVLSISVDLCLLKKHVLNLSTSLPHTSARSADFRWTVVMGTLQDIIRPTDVTDTFGMSGTQYFKITSDFSANYSSGQEEYSATFI